MFLRGRLRPRHAGYTAIILRRKPYSSAWTRFGKTTVTKFGKVRFQWKTRKRDAVQNRPYWFKLKILKHGSSNKIPVWVIFGE